MSPSVQKTAERGSFHRLAEAIREEIGSGRLGAGQQVPSVRRLSREHNLACDTVHRAMKALAAEGLVAAEPRRGYRVMARANDPDRGCPVALVLEAPERGGILAEQKLLTVFQDAAGRRGRPVLAIAAGGQPWPEVVEQLRVARAWGVILDTCSEEALALVRQLGLPAVVVDFWTPEVAVDCVIQDGYRGSMLAAAHLAGRGHRRIGWVGPALSACSPIELERFSGAAGALASAGIELTPDLRAGTAAKDHAGYVEGLRRMLSRPDRPTAVLAMWQTAAQAVAVVAAELDLEIGRDLDVVGWATEQGFDAVHRPHFKSGAVPPAVTWSVADMAEAALARLVERRENPGMAPVHVRIPTRLRFST